MVNRLVETMKKNLEEKIFGIRENSIEIFIETKPEDIVSVTEYIYQNIECALIMLFGNDERPINSLFAIYYIFALRKINALLTIKISLNDLSLKLPSITPSIPAAGLYEREIKDMFGIHFEGHPDPKELIFHENWPSMINPLKKDYDPSKRPPFINKTLEFTKIEGKGVFEIPVGPVHAGIIEPGHFRFSVAGEPIVNLEAKLYYVHKGIEKLSEGEHFEKVQYIAERISGDETISNSLAYALAIEDIADLLDVPERAQYIRTILCELERIYNHIGDISGILIDVAYSFAAYQFSMMRRWCLVLNEELTRSRFLRSSIRPGGVRKDFIKDKEKHIIVSLDRLMKEFIETVEVVKNNPLFIDRVENTGVVKKNVAIDLNCVGPAARASGLLIDVRSNYPYDAYRNMTIEVPTYEYGDVNARMRVKIKEVIESVRIIKECLDKMPTGGKIIEKIENIVPYKYALSLTESPRGENCHFVMSGEKNTIYRYKIRTPSFCNWPVLCQAVNGNIIPDFPLINKSLNLSYAGNDL